jgi:hypothetical protein
MVAHSAAARSFSTDARGGAFSIDARDRCRRLNPDDAPPFDQSLVGKEIEVLWKYFHKDTKEPHLIWAAGKILRVADGLNDTRSARAKKLLPAGALLWAWEADADREEMAGEQWLVLLPRKWKRQQHYSWRYAPAELARMRGIAPPPARACLDDHANLRRAEN